jgi:DNA-binding transcriptional ArsR family regulator
MEKRMDDIFYALSDTSRRRILMMLSDKEMSVNNIAEHFKFSRPATSKHIKVLEKSKLVISRNEGRNRYFRLNPKPIKDIYKWLEFYNKFWNEKLNALKIFVENSK